LFTSANRYQLIDSLPKALLAEPSPHHMHAVIPDFKLGWHGAINQKLDVEIMDAYYTAEDKQKRLNEAVNKILEDFPPKPNK
jgi:hypothetical protein